MNFNLFSGSFSNQQVVFPAHILYNVKVEFIAGYPNALIANNTTKGNNGNFSGTATNIYNHVALWLHDVNTNSHGSGHGFMNQINFLCTTAFSTVLNSSLFNFCNARWDADNHLQLRRNPFLLLVNHFDHSPDHVLCSLKICNNTIFQRSDGFNALIFLTKHLHGLFANGNYIACSFFHRDDGRFVHHNFILVNNQRVGRSQVNSKFLCKKTE